MSRPKSRSKRSAAAPKSGRDDARERLADRLARRDWSDIVRYLCARDGVVFEEGPLTTTLAELERDAKPSGMHWARRSSWAENLVLPYVVRVAQRLERAARAHGYAELAPSWPIAMRAAKSRDPLPGPLPADDDGRGWLEATWRELDALTDVLKHTLTALAERDERQRQLGALRGGASQRTSTRAVLEHLKHEHGRVSTERLRDLLRDLDLSLPPPWETLDRAVLSADDQLQISMRGRSRKTQTVTWARVKRVAKSIGLLESSP